MTAMSGGSSPAKNSYRRCATAKKGFAMSNIELSIDGERVVKVEVNMAVLFTLLQSVSPRAVSSVVPTSTVATREQIAELLSRIDARSVQFLKQIAANDDGAITWGEMRTIFGFKNVGDWAAFSGSFGKGITRALRHILGDKSARLVWWD